MDTLLKGWDHLPAAETVVVATLIRVFKLSIVAVIIKNKRYHKVFEVLFQDP